MDWRSTKLQLADKISRTMSWADSIMRPELAHLINTTFGIEIDAFASLTNAINDGRFCSRQLANGANLGNAFDYTFNDTDRVYLYPPAPILPLVLANVLPQLKTCVLVMNASTFETANFVAMDDLFDYRIKLGTSKRPAILRPARNQAIFDGETQYFTGNLEIASSWLFVRGYPRSFGQRLIRGFQQALSHRASSDALGLARSILLTHRRNTQFYHNHVFEMTLQDC